MENCCRFVNLTTTVIKTTKATPKKSYDEKKKENNILTDPMKTLPVQKFTEAFGSVSLNNALSSWKITEAKHVLKHEQLTQL